MKKIPVILALTILLLACNVLSVPATQQFNTVSTIPAPTEQAPTAPATAAPTGISLVFQNVSIVIPTGLASGAQSQEIAAVNDEGGAPWEVGPAHMTITLTDYIAERDDLLQPTIYIYPAAEFAAMSPGAANSLPRLKAILADPSMPLTHDTLPNVPFYNADQIVAAQTQRLPFKSGSGVRVVAQYAQGVGPISNEGLLYHFEGLTSDGAYYIIATLPINAPFLASTSDPAAPLPSDGIPFPDLNNVTDPSIYTNYLQAVTDKLNATNAAAFQPTLTALDALIQSITVFAH